eukprot:CAMPEP_0197621792 /NCGR_PEP_ID=MMETSP1338-20131121/2250_1 /TAXON_ID=43686 ORGANISM="Pelagodinium beii, Strain RCC1491" /NCGR_SAMPLE_ID=MMETSP1338 /ASSEMBLY_ACC=CAM_ASM_000754 /LENGTH=886 /DNA_ID=CAMNT_0043191333 /DNA_START=38 /DNA_END=2698 /DNA_ORIENTATION=-
MAWQQQAMMKGGGKGGPAMGKGYGQPQGGKPSFQPKGQVVQPRPAGVMMGGGGGASSSSITVSGCQNLTVSNIIKGTYSANGANHGKTVYKKDGQAGGVTVLIYYWDERDGPSFSGWWFGPKVGGDQVWAYNGNKAAPAPPPNGWKVPWDGQIDNTLSLTTAGAAGKGAAPAPGGIRPPGMVQPGAVRPPPGMIQKQAEQAKQREEEQQKRQAELKAKREQEENRRKEQAAALAVRKAIQKVRTANPDNYDELRAQLEEAQASNLEAMGSQAEKVSQEATTALEQAQKRIDEVNEKRVQEEQNKLEAEKKKKELEEKVDAFVTEAKNEATAMLEKVKLAEEGAQKLEEGSSNGSTPDAMVAEAESAETLINETMESAKSARLSIIEKQKELADAESFRKVKREILELTSKLAGGVRSLDRFSSVIKTTREKAAKKSAALAKLEEKKAEFKKYDLDKDGKLSRKEVVAYCKAIIQFELGVETLDTIMKSLEPITAEKFRPMHQKVCIAKSEVLEERKRQEEEAKRKVIEEQKQAIKAILEEASKLQASAEESAVEAETKARPLIKDSDKPAGEIQEAATEAENLMKKSEEALDESAAKLKQAKEECEANEDLKGFDQEAGRGVIQKETRIRSRLSKVAAGVKMAREKATRKAFAEIDQKRTAAATAIRTKMTEDSKTGEQFFDGINGGSALSKEKFAEFLKGLPGLELKEDDADKLFENIAGDADVSKERFLELVRVYYKCVKATVMSEDISIKSKTMRRLELGEVLEALEGPSKEEASGVDRVRCQSTQDDTIGWVTLAGNQGTAFLEPGGNFYQCVKETLLTDGLSVQDSKTIRRITKGEVIEVLEFQKKDASDLKRIKGKAKLDGACGWITLQSNQGTAFLEPC